MQNIFYLPWWFVRARFGGRKAPLQTVLFISDQCNLHCKHCNVYSKTKAIIKSYDQIKEELQYSYRLGSRFVDFEGGEPLIWKDGNYKLNDLCDLAKKIGFFSTTITTNAQLPFKDSHADSIWVSMDGTEHFHDEIRGTGAFSHLEKNIAESGHPHLSVNMVINNLNYRGVRQAVEFAARNPGIQSISLNFHTPYQGTENLHISDPNLRAQIIDEIIALKKQKYPIMNSISGLKLMKDNNFPKQCWVSNFIMPDGSRYTECPGKTAGVCADCGFC
ncbi:MAG: radical SAM protein, partial [Bacteroidales bacterium]